MGEITEEEFDTNDQPASSSDDSEHSFLEQTYGWAVIVILIVLAVLYVLFFVQRVG